MVRLTFGHTLLAITEVTRSAVTTVATGVVSAVSKRRTLLSVVLTCIRVVREN